MTMTVTVRGEPILLDTLLVRRFGFTGQKLLTKTLELNPDLASKGSVLPLGREVVLPDVADVEVFKETPRISLFG